METLAAAGWSRRMEAELLMLTDVENRDIGVVKRVDVECRMNEGLAA